MSEFFSGRKKIIAGVTTLVLLGCANNPRHAGEVKRPPSPKPDCPTLEVSLFLIEGLAKSACETGQQMKTNLDSKIVSRYLDQDVTIYHMLGSCTIKRPLVEGGYLGHAFIGDDEKARVVVTQMTSDASRLPVLKAKLEPSSAGHYQAPGNPPIDVAISNDCIIPK